MSNHKSSIISVRVDEDVKQKLSVENEMNNVTMNTLISQILSKHVKWDCFAEDIGFVFLTKPSLKSIFEEIDEESIKRIALSTCRYAIRDAFIFIKGELNITNFLEVIDLWLNASHVLFRHITTESDDKYIIQHELGKKFSIYIVTIINAILNEMKFKATNQKIDEQSVIFTIKKVL